MGRIDDALKKAAEERDRRRRGGEAEPLPADAPVAASADAADEAPAAAAPASSASRPAARSAPSTSGRVDERVVAFHSPGDRRAEEFRRVRTGLLSEKPRRQVVLLTSGEEDEGKSLVVANLAASLAETGGAKVLVIDADLRAGMMTALLGGRAGPGFADCLGKEARSPKGLIAPTGVPGVDLLGAGSLRDNPGSLLAPGALTGVLADLRDKYDHILVDAPPMEAYSDAQVLGPEADGVLLVVQVGGPPRLVSERALSLLDAVDAQVLGTVVTNAKG